MLPGHPETFVYGGTLWLVPCMPCILQRDWPSENQPLGMRTLTPSVKAPWTTDICWRSQWLRPYYILWDGGVLWESKIWLQDSGLVLKSLNTMTLVPNWYINSRKGVKTAPLFRSARWAVLSKSLLGSRF